MMRQMMGGGGMPGMPAIPGMRRAVSKSAKQEGEEEAQGRAARRQPGRGRQGAGGKVQPPPRRRPGQCARSTRPATPGPGRRGCNELTRGPGGQPGRAELEPGPCAASHARSQQAAVARRHTSRPRPGRPGQPPGRLGLLGRRRAKKDDDK